MLRSDKAVAASMSSKLEEYQSSRLPSLPVFEQWFYVEFLPDLGGDLLDGGLCVDSRQ